VGIHQKETSLVLFGKRLRAIREAANVSQEQLQYATGISQSQIGRIESGTLNTGINHVSRIAEFFGLEDFELFQYKAAVPDSDDLKRSIAKYLKIRDIEPSIFLRKSIVFYLETKVFPSKFLNTPKYTYEIAEYLEEKYNAKFTTTGLSQALERFRKKGFVEKLATDKKSKFRYRKNSGIA
jgi:transcriptional regulator with XRE-family HTH domain